MKNKSGFIIVFLFLALFLFAFSSHAQDAKNTIDRLIKTAQEKQDAARNRYAASFEENKPQQEQDSLKAEWQKATDDVRDLQKVKKELESKDPPVKDPPVKDPPVKDPPLANGDGDNNSGQQGDTSAGNQSIEDTDCSKKPGSFSIRLCDVATKILSNGGHTINLDDVRNELALLIYGRIVSGGGTNVDERIKSYILDAEEKRTDKQVGNDANTKGTTSIVVKGGIPNFLNFATENGAAIRSVSGTTVNFRFNPVGIFQSLTDYDPTNFLENYWTRNFKPKDNKAAALAWDALSKELQAKKPRPPEVIFSPRWTNYLSKLAIGLSFDASRGQEVPTLVGNEQQLSAFSLRYEFFNDRDPRNPKWKQKWNDFFKANNESLIAQVQGVRGSIYTTDARHQTIFKNPDLVKWFSETNVLLAALTSNPLKLSEVTDVLTRQLALLPTEKIKADKPLIAAFQTISDEFVAYNQKRKELLNEIAKAPVMTIEYTNNRYPVEPDTHGFNFILAKGFSLGGGKDAPVMDLTLNASLSFFNRKPMSPDVKRIRDFSFAGQLDVPLGFKEGDSLYGSTFSFAGKYQRLTGDITALDGTVVPNTKGDIWVGQAKLEIPVNIFGIKGIKFPISATFANRTELVRESHVRGNFGFTFDLDKLILNNFLKR